MLELIIKKDELARGVGQTSAIAEKRSSMPILSNILLEARDGQLRLSATDMEISFQGSYPAEVAAEGRLTVPAKKLNEVARLLNAEDVRLREDDNFTLNLAAGQFTTHMYGLSPADFPLMPDTAGLPFMEIESQILIGAIDKTIFSVAVEEARYNLSGVYLEKVAHGDRESLRFVSTDGHRLNMADVFDLDLTGLEMAKGVLVSKKGLSELKRLAETAETVHLGVTPASLVAKTEAAVLVMRLLEGRFPDYNLVIPKDNDRHLLAPRRELLEALKRISTMSSDDYKAIKLKLEPNRLTISSMTPDLGTAEESLEVEYSQEPQESGANPRFFIEALSALSGEKVSLSFQEPAKPVLVTSVEDPGYCGVIMAMKI